MKKFQNLQEYFRQDDALIITIAKVNIADQDTISILKVHRDQAELIYASKFFLKMNSSFYSFGLKSTTEIFLQAYYYPESMITH